VGAEEEERTRVTSSALPGARGVARGGEGRGPPLMIDKGNFRGGGESRGRQGGCLCSPFSNSNSSSEKDESNDSQRLDRSISRFDLAQHRCSASVYLKRRTRISRFLCFLFCAVPFTWSCLLVADSLSTSRGALFQKFVLRKAWRSRVPKRMTNMSDIYRGTFDQRKYIYKQGCP
jgi:hypothetical protein